MFDGPAPDAAPSPDRPVPPPRALAAMLRAALVGAIVLAAVAWFLCGISVPR